MSEGILLMSPDDVAVKLHIGRSTVFWLLQSGQIRSIKIGRLRRVPVAEVEAYLARQVAEQCGEATVNVEQDL